MTNRVIDETTRSLKIARFHQEVGELYTMTQSPFLKKLLESQGPRVVKDVYDAITSSAPRQFTRRDVEQLIDIIKASGPETDIPVRITKQLQVEDKVRSLIQVYADILGVPNQGYIRWAEGPKLDQYT